MQCTDLSKPHLISQNTIIAFAPQKREPVETCQLEVLQRSASGGDIFRIFVHPLEIRPRIPMVREALVRESAFSLPLPVRRNKLLCDRIDILLEFPGAMVVVESLPLAKVFHVAVDSFSMRNNAFSIAESLEIFLLSLLFEQEGFPVFLRYSRSIDA